MSHKVTVIIPTYKRSDFLCRAIDSILSQTYKTVEIIVIDDNHENSDYRVQTEKIMQKYNDNEMVIYHKNTKNLGGALARNVGIKLSTGDYITFLDDDDVYDSLKIETQLKYMIDNCLDLSFTDVKIFNMDDKLVDYRNHKYITKLSNDELLKQHILHHLTPTDTYMFLSDKIKELGGFDDVSMGQEFRLMLKAIEANFKIGYLPVAYVTQYIHAGERISVGENKIIAERELYKFKKNYFNYLSYEQKKYVTFRHYSVLFFVGIRSGKYLFAFINIFFSFFSSPKAFMKELLAHYWGKR